jgi:hypothetical protein
LVAAVTADEYRHRRERRARAARRAAQRRHPAGRGRTQPSQADLIRLAPISTQEVLMSDQHDDTAEVREQLPEDKLHEAEVPEETMTENTGQPGCEACPYPDVCAPARGCALRSEHLDRSRRADALIAAAGTDLLRRIADQISPLEHAARIFEQQTPGPGGQHNRGEHVNIGHWHVVAVQDHGTGREWWTIRTNQYDRSEAEQHARQLLNEPPHDQDDDSRDDHAETGDDRPEPAWSAIWLTSCTVPCRWAGPAPGLIWHLPPSGDPCWHKPGPPHPTRNVSLLTIQPATEADLELLKLTPAELALLEPTPAELAGLADVAELTAALEASEDQPGA